MDEKKVKGVCHERPAREDMISKLPDSLISQILFYLLRTSVLSHRWESLWLLISELDLSSSEFPEYNAFVGFVDRFLEKSCLHKLKLKILKRKNNKPCVMRWVDFVARRKLIKHVDVEYIYVSRKRLEVMPVSLYVCETLLYLRLNRVFVGSLDSVSLPYLKTMRLDENMYDSDTGIESLISSCPALEDLSIVRRLDDNVRVLRVHSQTITSLRVEHDCSCDHAFFYFDWETLALFIDAPRLKYLNYNNEIAPSEFISNLGSLVKVHFVGDVRITYSHDMEVAYHSNKRSVTFSDVSQRLGIWSSLSLLWKLVHIVLTHILVFFCVSR
ncbi:PREDICTED: FBD-associated F-box protein At5g22730-like [Brassica oleracea var. oleracea]|uniref:FBD-associated F-box protein At5g22730-like n=1 Tax=Brassica oleracea var. oleracea TaxID=109376 RepID=UPI0006A6A408|nr:PREDICTED: FBD-associated F-box protein At5g22730-like [Brassica oleracea var. oleracea]